MMTDNIQTNWAATRAARAWVQQYMSNIPARNPTLDRMSTQERRQFHRERRMAAKGNCP